MKTYAISIPIAGYAYKEVEAETEEEATAKAFEDLTFNDIEEWEAFRQITKGNVLYAPLNEIEIEEI